MVFEYWQFAHDKNEILIGLRAVEVLQLLQATILHQEIWLAGLWPEAVIEIYL
jgi:hypothetical protein